MVEGRSKHYEVVWNVKQKFDPIYYNDVDAWIEKMIQEGKLMIIERSMRILLTRVKQAFRAYRLSHRKSSKEITRPSFKVH